MFLLVGCSECTCISADAVDVGFLSDAVTFVVDAVNVFVDVVVCSCM